MIVVEAVCTDHHALLIRIYVPSGSASSATAINNPRVLVVMGPDSSLEMVEEFAAGAQDSSKYFTNAVMEVQLEQDAQLKHG